MSITLQEVATAMGPLGWTPAIHATQVNFDYPGGTGSIQYAASVKKGFTISIYPPSATTSVIPSHTLTDIQTVLENALALKLKFKGRDYCFGSATGGGGKTGGTGTGSAASGTAASGGAPSTSTSMKFRLSRPRSTGTKSTPSVSLVSSGGSTSPSWFHHEIKALTHLKTAKPSSEFCLLNSNPMWLGASPEPTVSVGCPAARVKFPASLTCLPTPPPAAKYLHCDIIECYSDKLHYYEVKGSASTFPTTVSITKNELEFALSNLDDFSFVFVGPSAPPGTSLKFHVDTALTHRDSLVKLYAKCVSGSSTPTPFEATSKTNRAGTITLESTIATGGFIGPFPKIVLNSSIHTKSPNYSAVLAATNDWNKRSEVLKCIAAGSSQVTVSEWSLVRKCNKRMVLGLFEKALRS